MASIEDRSKHNDSSSFRVIWRENGKRQGQTWATRAGAEAFKAKVEAAGNRWPPGWVPGDGPQQQIVSLIPTFAEWGPRAIQSRARANERTRADYLRDFHRHLEPAFGEMRLDVITREDVGKWLIQFSRRLASEKRDKEGKLKNTATVSPKTIANVHGLASSIMASAVEEGLISRNVFKGASGKLPAVKSEEMCFLSRQELNTIVAAMATPKVKVTDPEPEMNGYQRLTLFLALTGLRWSEATALTIADVSVLGRKTVTVSKAWKRQPDGSMELGEPKSRRSRRTISLPVEAVDIILPLVTARGSNERLFTSAMGHTVHHGQYWNRVWQPAIKKARAAEIAPLTKQPRIHDIRHSHASWLIAEGVDLVSIQRRLGHESIQTTIDRYGHLASDADDRINAALDRGAAKRETESDRSAGITG